MNWKSVILSGLFYFVLTQVPCFQSNVTLLSSMEKQPVPVKRSVPINTSDHNTSVQNTSDHNTSGHENTNHDNTARAEETTVPEDASMSKVKESLSESDQKSLNTLKTKLEKKELYPWYSNKSKELVFIPPPEEKIPDIQSGHYNTSNSFNQFFTSGSWYFLLTLFSIITILFALVLYRQLSKRRKSKATESSETDTASKNRRVANLPKEVHESLDELLSLTDEYYQLGDYRRAIIFYFSFILVEMDKAHLIRMNKGKTNHDFLPLLRPFPDLMQFYRRAMELFEKTYYGTWQITQFDFEKVWSNQEQFLAVLYTIKAQQKTVTGGTHVVSPIIKSLLLGGILSIILFGSGCWKKKTWGPHYERYASSDTIRNSDESINGISLLQQMSIDKGFQTRTSRKVFFHADRAKDLDAIIWFTDTNSFFSMSAVPDDTETAMYEQWLKEKKNRTLIIVNFGYYAEVPFWERMLPCAPEEHKLWVKTKLIEAKTQEQSVLNSRYLPELTIRQNNLIKDFDDKAPSQSNCPVEEKAAAVKNQMDLLRLRENWYHITYFDQPKTSSQLTGDPYWTKGVNVTIPFRFLHQIEPVKETQTLLSADEYPLICRRQVGESQVFIVQSGNFLLNYPLLEEGNQILASRLLDQIGTGEKRVLFYTGCRLTYKGDQEKNHLPAPFFFSTSPFSVLFWHALVLTILITLWKIPIFGRPKQIPSEMKADFGKHLTAYGKMLEKTEQRSWATQQIGQYYENYKKE